MYVCRPQPNEALDQIGYLMNAVSFVVNMYQGNEIQ